MRKRIVICLLVLLFGFVGTIIFYQNTDSKKDEKSVPAEVVSVETKEVATPKQTIQPTPETTPNPTKKQKKEKVHLPPELDIPLDYDVQIYIYKQCGYDNSLYCLVIAMIEQESGFKENEVSVTNDYGLMQINSCNHDDLRKKYGNMNFLDPYDNTYCGIKIIKGYIKKYEYKNLALMAYNMGEGGARRLWRKEIYSSRYSRSVLKKYERYIKECDKNE